MGQFREDNENLSLNDFVSSFLLGLFTRLSNIATRGREEFIKGEVMERISESVIMERFHLEIELDEDDARRVQAVLMANDMTMKQFTEYAIVKVAEAHVGDNLLLTD